jgi:hypothetical protein
MRETLRRAVPGGHPSCAWPLAAAAALTATTYKAERIEAGGPPSLHFSRKLEVIIWSLEREP